jgi:hypothetical protein
MKIRLWHKDARWVWVLRRRDLDVPDPAGGPLSEHRWLAVHFSSYPWAEIFRIALERLPVTTTPVDGGFDFDNDSGDLRWTPGRYWTTINLRLKSGSLLKRQLIAGTLLKAARYQLE